MASKFLNISTDNTLGGNNSSDEIVSSQKATKYYIDNVGGLRNTSTGTNSLTINGTASTASSCINIGASSTVSGAGNTVVGVGSVATAGGSTVIGCSSNGASDSVAVGYLASAGSSSRGITIGSQSVTNTDAIAIGYKAKATKSYSIQIGQGTNSTAHSLQIGDSTYGNYQLLNTQTGIIPYQRIDSLMNSRNSDQVKTWVGTKTQYDAITNKDPDTLYNITDDIANPQTSATISLDNLSSAGQAVINGRVNKAGDTMTGDLGINKDVPSVITKNSAFDVSSTTAPADNLYALSLRSVDVNDNFVGQFGIFHNIYNDFIEQIILQRSVGGETKYAYINLAINSSGNDAANASSGVMQSITNWGSPSSTYKYEILGASGATYTAPYTGWFFYTLCYANINGIGIISMVNTSKNGTLTSSASVNGEWAAQLLPVCKGDVVQFSYYNCGFSSGAIGWIKAVGG